MRLLLWALAAFAAAAAATAWLMPARPPAFPIPAPTTATDRVRYPPPAYASVTMPGGERRPVKSLLNVPRTMRFGDFVWNDAGVAPGRVWIRVDPAHQLLSVFRDGEEIGSTLVLFGADAKPTPAGLYPVLAKAARHRSTLYDADMPYMLRLTADGVAIHASDVRAAAATHGCIGVPLAFARRLFAEVRLGDEVAILPAAPTTS